MAPHIGAMAGCSGDHSKYQEAVAVAEAKVAEAISEAEEGHRSALALMEGSEQRSRYIGIIKDEAMRARLEAYSAGLGKTGARTAAKDNEGPDQSDVAMDDKNDKRKERETPSAEVAELREELNAVRDENEQLAMAAVLPQVTEMVNSVPKDARQATWDRLSAYTPAEIRAIHSLGLHRGRAAAPQGIYTASSLLSVPPAQTGMEYGRPAPSAREISPLIPHQGGLPQQAPAVAAVDGEFEVQLG